MAGRTSKRKARSKGNESAERRAKGSSARTAASQRGTVRPQKRATVSRRQPTPGAADGGLPPSSSGKLGAPAEPLRSPPPTSFPIVGIGTSAGGLEALEQFLKHVPQANGMAFVVVQHLDPTHKGMLVELLGRAT